MTKSRKPKDAAKPILGIRLGPRTLERLRQGAAEYGISVSELARRILDAEMDRRTKSQT
jgi:hypothetical protein